MSTDNDRWGPYPLVLAGAVLAVAYAALAPNPDHLYWAGFALGALIALSALIRLAGGGGRMAVRKRPTDAVTLGLLGLALMGGSLVLRFPDLMPV
ncbi:hypothetical protein GCM10010156_45690 [Planobispora rosea]|uniref:DUF3017 domain-containing protein n=1 Tax=Planobispora rosea TaxID=35762 RepID=A0A8J3SA58_PLARO|nr:DUF3017 domain-containing protein [Planobispora rosea]GGS81813.1 hypothetical protein GCM10010156_45690 [Planobispora rosea]GIH86098.1 hypothetical protein Pro02_45060 [Planobispora rosea]